MREGAVPTAPGVELGRVERVVAVRSLADWMDLAPYEIAVLASIARPRAAGAGTVLVHRGHPVTSMFLVVDGELGVRRDGMETRVGAHDLACATLAFSGDPSGCECVATKDSVVLEIAVDDLEDVFEDHPTVLARAIARVARHALALHGDEKTGAAAPVAADRAARVRSAPTPHEPIDLVQRILALRRTRALAGSSIDGFGALATIARELRVPSGTVLWRAGDLSGSVLALVSGAVELRAGGRRDVVIPPGELVGALDTLACERRAHDVVAVEPVVALVIERDAMLDAWEDHVELGTAILRSLSRDVLSCRAR